MTHTKKVFLSGHLERVLHRVPVPWCELDRALHEVPHGAGAEEGVPGDQAVAGDEVQDAEGEREAGEAAAIG